MTLAGRTHPISYLKTHTAEIVRRLAKERKPLMITQNGEASLVIQSIAEYEQHQETLALLKILALGNRQVEQGRVQPADRVLRRLRKRQPER